MNLINIFYEKVETQPDHPLIIGPDEKVFSYKEFYNQIQKYIIQLKAAGVEKGHSIGLYYPNAPQYISLTYAVWGCGACIVPIPVELTGSEKQQIFNHIRIDAVISKVNLVSKIKMLQNSENTAFSEDIVFIPVKKLREHPPGFADLNAAFIRFTSGTTGAAKGVVLSHETIQARIKAANQGLHINPCDRIIWVLSMAYHFTVSIVAYMSFGATMILCKNHFGTTIVRTAAKHKATIIYGAPTHYELMTHDKSDQLLPDLRLAITTTTSLRKETGTAFYKRFKKTLNETYGIIEVGLPCINFEKQPGKGGSVGRLLPAYEIKMELINKKTDLQAIKVRGPGMVDAYYEPWKTRAEIMQNYDGWFATGDMGYYDQDGFLFICGRSKDMISVGGMKFFPQEVETLLETDPAVKEACVFGYDDQRLGELPYAHLVAESSVDKISLEKTLKELCRQHLATYKIPQKFYFVAQHLRTASGKLIRDASKLKLNNKLD